MKSVVIIHDKNYSDVNRMMDSIDYVAQHSKTFDGEFTVYLEEDSPLVDVISDSGLPLQVGNLPEEPDTVIVFTYDDLSTNAHQIMMNQWQSRRPVYPFMVTK